MPTASPRTLEKPNASFSVVTGSRSLAPSEQVPDLRRGLLLVALAALMSFEVTRDMTIALLSDAFWQVASYVAFTLALFYAIQERLQRGSRLSGVLSGNRSLQVAFGAGMGVLPGCGGALIVITQFVKKQVSFGALVAAIKK